MKYALAAMSVAMLGVAAAHAQTAAPSTTSPTATTSPSTMQMSASDCTNLWQKANSANAKGLTESQAAPYVNDFKAANPDGDTTIDQTEWLAACNKGLVKSSSSSGASTGTSGSSSTDRAKEHPPTNRMDDLVPDMKSPEKSPNKM